MTAQTQSDDATEVKIAEYSRESYDEFLADFRDVHGEPVAELPSMVVFADEHGHEINEWANDLDLERETVESWMHDMARGVDYNWSTSDPVVLLRD